MLFTNHTKYRIVSKFFWHWNDVIVIVGDNAIKTEKRIRIGIVATNTAEAAKMIQEAKDHNVLLMEVMKSTLLPNFKAIKNNLHYSQILC